MSDNYGIWVPRSRHSWQKTAGTYKPLGEAEPLACSVTVETMEDSMSRIVKATRRAALLARGLHEAQELNYGPGSIDTLLSPAFHREATGIYSATLKWTYLSRHALAMESAANAMTVAQSPRGVEQEWIFVCRYLSASSLAIFEQLPDCSALSAPEVPHVELDHPPSVLRFDLLAQLASRSAVEETLVTTRRLADAIVPNVDCPISDWSVRLLGRMVTGQRVADVAIAVGYSERSLYRHFGEMWRSLEVEGRAEAIHLATEKGWLRLHK